MSRAVIWGNGLGRVAPSRAGAAAEPSSRASARLTAAGLFPRPVQSQVVRAYFYAALFILDALVVFASFAAADWLHHRTLTQFDSPAFVLIVPLFVVSAFFFRCYSFDSVRSMRRGATQVAAALASGVTMALLASFALKSSDSISRLSFFAGATVSLVMLVLIRLPLPRIVDRLGARFVRRVLVVDGAFDGPVPSSFELMVAERHGIMPNVDDPMMLHRFSQLVFGADRVVVACPVEHRARWTVYLRGVDCTGELLLPELQGVDMLHDDSGSGLFGVPVSTGSLDIRNRVLKRLFDLSLAVPAIVLLSPLFLVVAIAILLEGGGPILFRQRRLGRGNQLFNVLKFRSMYTASADADGTRSAGRGDERVTRIGRFIRATSIDELPQLFNVINGDMSLVGPRPHALGSLAGDQLFWNVDPRYWRRHAIKPGLTGLAQVRGFRGSTAHREDLANRLESDLDYLADWSLLRDAGILVRTLFVLIHRNAY